jgi:hypothetical protein
MMEKIMTNGMELDEVNGDERNLATTILDDADLEVVSGGREFKDMNDALLWAAAGFKAGAFCCGTITHHR